jgi:hypothetical protein
VTKVVADTNEGGAAKGHVTMQVSHVVEQRVSNLAQGLLTLGTMSGPLLIVLHLIPQGVLAGLFFVMGMQALAGNGIMLKLLFLCRDRTLTSASEPLKRIRRRGAVWAFVGIQLFGFGATFAITQTIAAVGFPIIILLLVPVRTLLLPKWFSGEELRVLDAPTASPFTMVSVGGNYGEEQVEDPQPTPRQSREDTAIPSRDEMESENMPIGDLAERGELPRADSNNGPRRRASRVVEDRNIEMENVGMNRRSTSRPTP